jgi:hypothetical protein
MKFIIGLIFFITSSFAQARVFDFGGESLAAYFHTTAGYSTIGNFAYANSSGENTVFTDTVPYIPGFELGFLFGIEGSLVVKIGAEIIQTKELSQISGKNAAGQELFLLDSKVFGFNPNLSIEFNISQDAKSRFFFATTVGWVVMSIDNGYTFSTPGNSELVVAADYIEKSEASVLTYGGSVGYETLAVDNVTIMLNAGYRHIPVDKMTYKHDYTDLIGSQTATKGDPVLNNDGTKRTFHFGGPFVGVGFRFYINFL